MSKDIRIRKGVSLKLKGVAPKVVKEAPRSEIYSIQPPDFWGLVPRLDAREGDTVKAGDALFHSKTQEDVIVTAPVSGTVAEIVRGQKRRILEVRIKADAKDAYKDFKKQDPNSMTAGEIKTHLLKSGCWPFIKQRPYDIIANPTETPRDIFISAYQNAPLQADAEFILKNRQQDFQTGINALSKLVGKKVHFGLDKNSTSYLKEVTNVEIHKILGPYPAGNVGVLIHHVAPINAGERVWTINPEDVAIIGHLFNTGNFVPARTVALAGSGTTAPGYYTMLQGAQLSSFLKDKLIDKEIRIISGTVFTGTKTSSEGYLGFYDNTLSVIPEGKKYRLFGWMPFVDNYIPSIHNTSLASLFKNKEFDVDTNLNGEERAFVVTGEMESVMPMDIYPMQLLKACMSQDIEKMENLGIYEVVPEDFAAVEFACTSKVDAQEIIRQGLDLMVKEVG